jgi:hypothetical protein
MEYACSELRSEGAPFAVILYLDGVESCALWGFVLRDWREELRHAGTGEIADIQIFLEDLRYYNKSDHLSSRVFFKSLEKLGVGPVRTLVSGSCAFEDLDTVLPLFFENRGTRASWQHSFEKISGPVAVG